MNKIILLGNITKEIELRKTQTNKSVTEFTLAVNEGYGEAKTTEFISIQAWDKNAENLAKFASKGTKVLVEGRWHNNSYQKQDGTKVEKSVVRLERFELIGRNEEKPVEKPNNYDELFNKPKVNNQIEIESDELPFY